MNVSQAIQAVIPEILERADLSYVLPDDTDRLTPSRTASLQSILSEVESRAALEPGTLSHDPLRSEATAIILQSLLNHRKPASVAPPQPTPTAATPSATTAATTTIAATTLPAGATRITFLSFNDVYEIEGNRGWGGFAGMATLLQAERRKVEHHFTTVNGDFMGGSIFSQHWKGAQMIDLFNRMQVDAVVPGNHEFDFGPGPIIDRVKESQFPWLGTNILEAEGPQVFGGMLPYITREFGSVRVGFFGVCTQETYALSNPGPTIRITDPMATARDMAHALRQTKGCAVVVALTHMGLEEDLQLARAVPEIDLILGGHEHHCINLQEGNCLIFKAGSNANWLGRVDLVVLPNGDVYKEWQMILNRDVHADPDIAQVIKGYTDAFAGSNAVLCVTKTALDTRASSVRSREAAMGNFVADIMRELFESEIAIVNGGVIRGDRTYEPGTALTDLDIRKEFPFANKTVLLEISGAGLLLALEEGLRRAEAKVGFFPHVSNMKIVYDSRRAPLHRIETLEIRGEPLDTERQYRVVVTSYMSEGGDGYDALKEALQIDHPANFTTVPDMVLRYLQTHPEIAPVVEGRMVDLASCVAHAGSNGAAV